MEQAERSSDVSSFSSTFFHLRRKSPTTPTPPPTLTVPDNTSGVHCLIHGDTSGEVGKAEQVTRVRRPPKHLPVSFPERVLNSHRGRVSSVLSQERRDASVGVVTMLGTFDASVIRSLKSRSEGYNKPHVDQSTRQ